MLYNELKTETIDSTKSLSDILRKTMVLSYKLKNDKLKLWVINELDGYSDDFELPSYRIFPGMSYGTFQSLKLKNGIKAIENLLLTDEETLQMPWQPNIIALYNSAYNQTGYSCVTAWRIVTKSQLAGITDSIRNKLLEFLLLLEDEYPTIIDIETKEQNIENEKVVNIFNKCIFQRNIDIGSDNEFSGSTNIQNIEE